MARRFFGVWGNFTTSSMPLKKALDPLNDTDIHCLLYIYVHKINKCSHDFVECWNNHQLSSEHNFTPYQLFLIGRPEVHRESPQESPQDHSQVQIPTYFRVSDPVAGPHSTFQP